MDKNKTYQFRCGSLIWDIQNRQQAPQTPTNRSQVCCGGISTNVFVCLCLTTLIWWFFGEQQPVVRLEKKTEFSEGPTASRNNCVYVYFLIYMCNSTVFTSVFVLLSIDVWGCRDESMLCRWLRAHQVDKRKHAHGGQTAEKRYVTPSQNRWLPRSFPSCADLKWPTKPTPAETPLSLAYPRFGLVEVRCCRAGGYGAAEIQEIKRGTRRSIWSLVLVLFGSLTKVMSSCSSCLTQHLVLCSVFRSNREMMG